MWWVYALLSAVCAAFTAVLAKVGMSGISTDLGTAIRTTVVLLLTWSIVFIKGDTLGVLMLSTRNWTFLLLSGIATGLSWLFYFRALQIGKVAQVAGVDKFSIVLAIVLAAIFLGETISYKQAIAILLILIGTLILIL